MNATTDPEFVDAVHEAFLAVDRLRRQRFSVAPAGFDRDEVLTAMSHWAFVIERALVECEELRAQMADPPR